MKFNHIKGSYGNVGFRERGKPKFNLPIEEDNRNLTHVWSLLFMSNIEIKVALYECHNSSYGTYRLVRVLLVLLVRETL